MGLLNALSDKWKEVDYPFMIRGSASTTFSEITSQNVDILQSIPQGAVVAIVGDFSPKTILQLLELIEMGAVVVPLTTHTRNQHGYFFEAALVDYVLEGDQLMRREHNQTHELLEQLRRTRHAGLILFSTGTTGRPKAILHDFTVFLDRYATPRPTFRTLSFLLFDHIGGLNTLFHTLFNRGTVVAPESRDIVSILESCRRHRVEVLPTTPTFLRMLLMTGLLQSDFPESLRVISYGTERMDQTTLDELCRQLPNVDFRQTYGMSELGILRVKSEARDSLFMRIGGEGVETRLVNNVLQIRSSARMLGYLNSTSPFDSDGWYDTKDVVRAKGDLVQIIGRTSEVVNVGGLKFMASEVEQVALTFPGIELALVTAKSNPITGQHIELIVQSVSGVELDIGEVKTFLSRRLESHMVPKRIRLQNVPIGHRFKRG